MNKNYCQHTFGAIANFVVSSRSRFARNIIFNRKYSVPKFATDAKRENVGRYFELQKNKRRINEKRKSNNLYNFN